MGPAIMPRLILLPLFFWLSTIFFSVGNPSFDTVKRLSWLDDKQYILLSLSGWTAKLLRSFSEGVWEGTLTCDTLLSDNLRKGKCLLLSTDLESLKQMNTLDFYKIIKYLGLSHNRFSIQSSSLLKFPDVSMEELDVVWLSPCRGPLVLPPSLILFFTIISNIDFKGCSSAWTTSAYYDLSAFSTFFIFKVQMLITLIPYSFCKGPQGEAFCADLICY